MENSDKELSNIDLAFSALDTVKQDDTQWSIVYNATDLSISFKTRENQIIRKNQTGRYRFCMQTPNISLSFK